MKSYFFRDSRRERLTEAIATLVEEQADLRSVLVAEQTALQTDDWTVTDTTFRAVAADWIWQNFLMIKPLADQDPVLVALGVPSSLTDTQAIAINAISIPHPPTPPADYLDQVMTAVDNTDTILTELIQAAHQVWSQAGPDKALYPFDDVGVLLPLRLETLFDAPASQLNEDPDKWKLSIRVIPDEASICRDNAFVSSDEGKSLLTFWQLVKQPGDVSETWLDGDAAEIAWKQLSDRIRPERAAWLVATIGIQLQDEVIDLILSPNMPAQPEPNRVGGLPPELKIFAVTTELIDGDDHHFIGRLPMDEQTQIDNSLLTLPLPSDVVNEKESWWASWEKAKTVGLGGEYLIPAGMTPQNLQALYVLGIGDEAPDAHFAAQVNAGELSVARLGDPTNSIKGSGTGDAIDWQMVARTRLAARLNPVPIAAATGNTLQIHLTGTTDALPFFPGANAPDDTLRSHQLVRALWPALWGHWLHDIWTMGDGAYRRGMWAFEHLYPEGPLMPIRIGDQPYGLLPVTALQAWALPAAPDPIQAAQRNEELAMAKFLANVSNEWANAVREKRNVVGKTSAQFMELLGQDALSNTFISRNFVPASTQMALYPLTAAQRNEFAQRALHTYDPAIKLLGRQPADSYLANSYGQDVRLPLVQSTHSLLRHQQGSNRAPLALTKLLGLLINFRIENDLKEYDLQTIFNQFHVFESPQQGEFQIASLPDSLLIRLIVYACQTSFLWHRADGHNSLLQQLLDVHEKEAMTLASEIDQDAWRQKDQDINGKLLFKTIIPDSLLKELERAFRATLDTAAQRIDPWITGFAWQRLKQHSTSSRHTHRLGAYGWVDGPFIGQPGPTEAGLLHTPSYNQALGAIIMRDKFLSSSRSALTNDRGGNPWQMNITSQKVRVAEEIADEVRMGFHIHEVVGRQVEHIVAKPIKVQELRTNGKYAMHAERSDRNEVCNGLDALPGLLKGDIDFPMDEGQQAALQLLQDALDTYSDLLTADGIIQLINRQTDRASETMDAAAGFSRPPSLDFIRTPPSGYHLESVVLSALPFVSVDDLAGDTHPIRLADPSVASFIDNKLGTDWKWTAINADDNAALGSVTLAMLGLSPIDTLAMPDDLISELVRRKLDLPLVYITDAHNRQWEAFNPANNSVGTIALSALTVEADKLVDQEATAVLIRSRLGVPDDAVIREIVPEDLRLWVARNENGVLLGMADAANLGEIPDKKEELEKRVRQFLGVPNVQVDTARQHQLAQQLVAVLGNRPAAGRDFTDDKSAPVPTDTSVYSELLIRYNALFSACQQLVVKLRNAADDIDRAAVLREALPWGMIPVGDPANREALMAALLGFNVPDSATPLVTLVDNVATALEKRLNDSVKPEELATELEISAPLADNVERKQQNKPDGVPTLARAIANLASPNARLAILACWDKTGILTNTGLVTPETTTIDEEWLTIVAPVRAGLARLEALQLELDAPFVSWTNSPDDPWRTGNDNLVQQNLATRNTDSIVKIKMTRFVAAYGTESTWTQDKIAVGLIDTFNEAIPMPHRKTMTAFGFNAPSSRAQQAILLAVPPSVRQRLDSDLLLTIVEETRTLAHARTARIEDLGNYQSLVPTMWFQASGPASVRLGIGTLFDV